MTESQIKRSDVVIVGAGMVGAALALAISSREDIRVILLDGAKAMDRGPNVSNKSVDDFDLRVSALTQASQKFLENLNVWPEIVKLGVSPYQKMHVWDAEGTGNVSFDAADLHRNNLGHIVENSVILASLHKTLLVKNNVECLFDSSVTALDISGSQPTIQLGCGEQVEAQLIIAADGANSRLRQWAGIPTREWDYQHHAIVCTVKTEKPHQATAWQRFLDTGPLAFLPLQSDQKSNHFSSIVWSVEPELATQLLQMNDEAFRTALACAFENTLGEISDVSARASFPLRQRHAKYYVKPGFAVVGDAAHTIHPLAGQGVNLGLADAMALAEEVLRAEALGLDLGDIRLLKRFERRRQGDNLAMMSTMEGFKRLFSQDDIRLRWLRNAGMNIFDKVPFIKKEVIGHAMGNHIRVPEFHFD